MRFLFSFTGRIGRFAYLASSLAVFLSQHLVALLVFAALGKSPPVDVWFYVLPPRTLAHLWTMPALSGMPAPPFALLYVSMLAWLVMSWALTALAFRRAADAGIGETVAAAAFLPPFQIPLILGLAILPQRAAPPRPPVRPAAGGRGAPAQGVIAGIGLTVLAVATGTLVLGDYGFVLFLFSPFVIGATTAYLANRVADVGAERTVLLVAGATVLGCVALVGVALEGAVCIVMAAPLGLGAAVIGGLLGRAIALHSRRSARQTLSSVALLPLVFAAEALLPATTAFETVETIVVAAPPERVWQALVHMAPIEEPPALLFRLGVAYPLAGEIIGEGVGAFRRGTFSTGVALERVTQWIPDRKLAFVVLSDVPSMHELSPYRHVHAPHVKGYFRTTLTSFELVPRPDGDTEIVERTAHELNLEPVLYWLPLARWVVHEDNTRVLAHIRRQAERRAGE